MEQFKPTLALNRGIDRSDEMARGFTLPLLHLFTPPILPPFLLNHSTDSFSTAEFHLYVNEEKGAILKPPRTHPVLAYLLLPHHQHPTTILKEFRYDY